MSNSEFWNILDRSEEIELTVKGRTSGKNISRPVWFVHESKVVYLLPVNGSDTEWYKNVLQDPHMKISVNKKQFLGIGSPTRDENKVKIIADKFRAKYNPENVARYYFKLDAIVEFSLQE